MVHYENNIHLPNEEHTKTQAVPVLSAKLHIKQADFLSNILKWFNTHLDRLGHGFSKTAPEAKPGKMRTSYQGGSQPCWDVDQVGMVVLWNHGTFFQGDRTDIKKQL